MSTILNAYNLNGGDTTSSVFTYAGSTRNLDIEILTSLVSGYFAYVTIETSADQTNWILVPDSQIQINRGSDSYVYHITESEGAYVRVRLFRMDAHSGTMTITASEAGGGSGTQTLNQTLVLGNTTGGEDISISNGDKIVLDNGSELRVGTYDFGGTGGISRICSVGYEDMWQSGIHHIFDNNGFIRESNNCFNYVPDNTFDNTLRFKVGSRWVLDDGTTYICTDATIGAAVWSTLSFLRLDGSNSPTADISFGSNKITDLANPNFISGSGQTDALNLGSALNSFVFFTPAITINGLVTSVGTETIVQASPNKSYDNYICLGIFLQPVNITGVGILNPIFNLGNDTGSFNDILNAFTPVFISFANTEVLKPVPLLVSGVSWTGKDIKCRVTTAATGYTTFDFSIRVALMCIT